MKSNSAKRHCPAAPRETEAPWALGVLKVWQHCSLWRACVCGVTLVLALGSSRGLADVAADAAPYLQAIEKKVEMRTLSNGLRVIFYRHGAAPVFSTVIGVKVGGVDEVPGTTGISHMLEHMAFKGTATIGTKDYVREMVLLSRLDELHKAGQSAGGLSPSAAAEIQSIEKELSEKIWDNEQFTREYELRGATGQNATTDKETTQYFSSLPAGALEFWCWIESERILNPVMRQFYKERDVVLEERRMRYDDSPQGLLYERLLDAAFSVHPYRYPVIGYQRDVSRLLAQQVADFHKRFYVPGNMAVSIVGNLDSPRVWAAVEKYFGRIPSGSESLRNLPTEPEQSAERRIDLSLPYAPQMIVAYKKPNWPDSEDPKIGMMLETFASGPQSPLYKELVQKQQIVVDASYFESPGVAYPNLAAFHLVPRAPHGPDEALRAFDSVVEEFKKGTAGADLLENSKRVMTVSMLGRLRSNSSLAAEFVEAELLHGDWNASLRWYEQALKVSLPEVFSVARKYLVPEHRIVGIVRSSRG